MSEERGYFCRSLVNTDLQSNVAVRTMREAEAELKRMIAAGATLAHAIQHGKSDREREFVALGSSNGSKVRAVDLRRYLYERNGPEYERWKSAYCSKGQLLDERWKVVALSTEGVHEYGAFGKAVLAETRLER